MAAAPVFIEVDSAVRAKRGQRLAGDVWLARRLPEDGRVVCALSDGLGSGVKASVLATLTATVAVRHAADERDPRACAEVLRRTLPVCSERGISYATFTIMDLDGSGRLRLVEYGNPAALLLRDGKAAILPTDPIGTADGPGRELRAAEVDLLPGDRVLVVSDGVTQAGMGGRSTPLGWGGGNLADFCTGALAGEPGISARHLARRVVERAIEVDGGAARDDTSCGVAYLRPPRRLLLITGAPYDEERDAALAAEAMAWQGSRVVCGGTTADILARELGRRVEVELGPCDPEVPPAARLAGFDLVTEGMITLSRCLAMLEDGGPAPDARRHAATRLAELLLDSDVIALRVGTRINQAHQDPALPMELGIRRNLMRALARVLEERYAKRVEVQFV